MSSPMRCPLCHDDAPFLTTHRSRELYRCATCDLVFLSGACHVTDEEARAEYLLHDNTMECEGYVRMFEDKIDVLDAHCPAVKTVLDYGCGPGPVLVELLNRRGYTAAGYDPLFFPDADLSRRYDCVISTEAFEHFVNPGREMERIGGLLERDGYLAVMTLLHDAKTDFGAWWYLNMPSHIVFYSARTFDRIAARFGYRLVYSDGSRFLILQRVDS